MAFNGKKLQHIALSTGSPRMFTYETNDTIFDVQATDYFLDAADILEAKDIIEAIITTNTTPQLARLVVKNNNGLTIDCYDGTTFSTADGS